MMREVLVLIVLLATLISAAEHLAQNCCPKGVNKNENKVEDSPQLMTTLPPGEVILPGVGQGVRERWRRAAAPPRLQQRGGESRASSLASSLRSDFSPVRGRRSSWVRQLSGEENNPFWAARGKKYTTLIDSEERPFWAARGKKFAMETEEEGDNPFWAARGKKPKNYFNSEENPFWAARGKKYSKFLESGENPFWAARGKKFIAYVDSGENPFWAARGKKYYSQQLSESEENPFWAARGKKLSQFLESLENPFYAPRGKKNDGNSKDNSGSNSKENPFWASRGRRTSSLYSLLNKRNNSPDMLSIIKPRTNREQTGGGKDPFAAVRGKRPSEEIDINPEDDEFWRRLENKTLIQSSQKLDDDEDLTYRGIINQIFGILNENKIKKKDQKKHKVRQLIVNPNYSTEFWSTRG